MHIPKEFSLANKAGTLAYQEPMHQQSWTYQLDRTNMRLIKQTQEGLYLAHLKGHSARNSTRNYSILFTNPAGLIPVSIHKTTPTFYEIAGLPPAETRQRHRDISGNSDF